MAVRFQADADLNQIIVAALLRRLPEVDFRTASAAGLSGLSDLGVLDVAARDGRVLVSHDQSTMPVHVGTFAATTASAGVIIVPQTLPVGQVVDNLALIWTASTPEEWTNRIVYLPL
jgi:hypothetical protein